MRSPVSFNNKPFVVPGRQTEPESRLAGFANRVVELNPWLLALGFTVFVLLCTASLDWYMLKHHESTLTTVEVSDVISSIVAGLLFLRIAQYRRERRRALRQRLDIIGDMNHHIRNALEVISLSAHTSSDQKNVKQIRDSVDRIAWALKEILPRM